MEILYSDDRVVVCVKPAGVLSTDEPGGMPERLRLALEDGVVKSVHRLDRAVGGVMVYARTKRAASDLGRQMDAGAFTKEYRAVVHGVPAEESGVMRDFLLRDTGRRMTSIAPEGTSGAQEALLDYRVLGMAEGMSLLAIRLHTGRTHQIRCQLAGRGLPIVGDRKYGVKDGAENIALWSYCVGFSHPRTGEELVFTREPPDTYPWDRFIPADNKTA